MSANANTLTCIPNQRLRAQGAAILRVAADLRNFLEGETDVPDSVFADIAEMQAAGEWLINASSITLPTLHVPAAGHPATGFSAT